MKKISALPKTPAMQELNKQLNAINKALDKYPHNIFIVSAKSQYIFKLAELLAKREAVDAAIEAERNVLIKKARSAIKTVAKEHSLTITDVFPTA